jgi:hypothetical protein
MTTKRKARVQRPAGTPAIEVPIEADTSRIVQHPDGFYWLGDEGRHETGPFDTFEAALADMTSAGELEGEPGETLQEAEAEIGISDWIDPETNQPSEEERPRLEEH